MLFITRQSRRLKWEDYLIITVSTFSQDLGSTDKFIIAYHVQLNTVFVKSSLTKTGRTIFVLLSKSKWKNEWETAC